MAEDPPGISKAPVNILFNPSAISKRNIWEIDLIKILEMLEGMLAKSGDLRVAGMAALSSSLIYRMKVESIFALQKAAAEKRPAVRRTGESIDMVDIPYRHESTYPVSLEDLMEMLEGMISSIVNPRSRKKSRLEAIEAPDLQEHLNVLENVIKRYEGIVMEGVAATGSELLQNIVSDMNPLDSVRCFFAALFLAKDQKVWLEQEGDDIRITLYA